jgi:hypothetical protein
MKFSALNLPGSSCIEGLIHAFRKIMGYEIASLLSKDHELTALDFTINSWNA